MKPLFRPGLNQPGTKLFKGFEPGRMALSLVPWRCRPQRRSGAAWRNNAKCTSQKIVEGMEPGEMLPLALGTDEEKPEAKKLSFHREEENVCVTD